MAIAKRDNCSTPTVIDEAQGSLNPPCYDTETCNTGDGLNLNIRDPSKAWIVDYYRQNIGGSDGTDHLDSHQNPVYQQYTHYKDVPIYIKQDISNQPTSGSNDVNMTGSATLKHIDRANVGDLLTAVLNDGTLWLLRVTAASTLTIMPGSDTTIEYTVTGRAVDSNPSWNTLLDKITSTVIFDKMLSETGGDAFITPEAAAEMKNLMPFIKSAERNYRDLLKGDLGTFGLTYQGKTIADPNMASMVNSLFPGACGGGIFVPDVQGMNQSLPHAVMNRGLLIKGACPFWCMRPVVGDDLFTMGSQIMSYGYVMVRTDSENNITSPCPPSNGPSMGAGSVTTEGCMQVDAPCCGCHTDPMSDIATDYGRTRTLSDGTVEKLIKNPFEDKWYIFTQAYYENEVATMSLLEKLVTRYIDNETITIADILPLWEDYSHWCNHSLYYYTPFLLLLSKYAMATKTKC